MAVLAVGVLLALLAVVARPPLSTIAWALSGLLPVAAIVTGIRVYRPPARGAWQLIGTGFFVYWIGVAAPAFGIVEHDSVVAQLVTITGYTGLLAGIVAVLENGDGEPDRSTLLEALIIATAAALVVWFAVVAVARADGGGASASDILGALGYPAIDVAMFVIAGRALLRYRHIGAPLWLLLPALFASAATDIAGLIAFATGTISPAWIATGGSLVGNAFVAAAAMHPGLAQPLLADPRRGRHHLRIRVALVGAATLIAPLMLLLYDVIASGAAGRLDVPSIGLAAIVIAALVIGDLYLLLSGLDRSLRTRSALEAELQHQAHSDSLTELPNRAAFVVRLKEQLARDPFHVALLFCDLDDFKTVNDTLGHAAGDVLLVEVGRRLSASVRPFDVAARLGGDEFGVLLNGIARREDADRVATRVLEAFAVPFDVDCHRFSVRISIGIAFGVDASDPSGLMRDADIAMYLAKGHGKGRFERYRPSSLSGSGSRLAMQTALERAIARQSLAVAYQPVARLSGREIVGVEALARWDDPDLGPVPAAEFIKLAESSGLIVPLGRQVLRLACLAAKAWLDAGANPALDLFVNVSPLQLTRGTFGSDLLETLRETRLPAERLVIEVTETALVDAPAAIAAFDEIRSLGVRIAIDDFGTGSSSIGSLDHFPIDILKIDRSFVAGLDENAKRGSLVRMIVALGDALHLDIIAEGIETDEQLEILRGLGCEYGQGYALHHPMPPSSVGRLLLISPAGPPAAAADPGSGAARSAGARSRHGRHAAPAQPASSAIGRAASIQ
jgi:diguanylate cyclase (GGDEF)-like protein